MSFFDSVIDFFNMIAELVQNAIGSLLMFFKVLYSSIALPSYLTLVLPSIVGACAVCVVAIAVLKLLVGR